MNNDENQDEEPSKAKKRKLVTIPYLSLLIGFIYYYLLFTHSLLSLIKNVFIGRKM